MRHFAIAATLSLLLSTGSLAAEPVRADAAHGSHAAGTGHGGHSQGKVSLQDFHFATRAEAVATCDKAPVSATPDGRYMCSMSQASYDLKTAKK